MTTINGFNSLTIFEQIQTNEINSIPSGQSSVYIDDSEIDLIASSVQINGVDILTSTSGVSNPLTVDLDAATYNIVNVNQLTTDSIGSSDLTRFIDFNTLDVIAITAPLGITINTPDVLLNGFNVLSTDVHNTINMNGNSITDATQLTTDYVRGRTIGNGNTEIDMSVVNNISMKSDLISLVGKGAFVDTSKIIISDASLSIENANTLNIVTPIILQNTRTSQLVDVHSSNNTFSGLTSAVGTQYCTSYGNLAGSASSLNYNTCIGYSTMPNAGILARQNTAIGALSLTSLTDGIFNTGCGVQALRFVTTSNFNSSFGHNSGYGITTGNNNVCIGRNANDSVVENGACEKCICLGNSTRTNNNISNTIVIGDSVVSTVSNEAVIGNSTCTILRNSGVSTCDLGTSSNRFKDLYLSTTGKINGLTTTGGVWMQLTEAIAISSALETDLILGSSSIGSLTIPANTFTISTYELNLFGNFSSQNGSLITFRFKFGAVVFSIITNLTGTSGEHFELECQFSISSIGGVGVASITLNNEFTYSDTTVNSFLGNRQVNINNTLFDTTISNTLVVTAQFSGGSNTIQCIRGTLSKIY